LEIVIDDSGEIKIVDLLNPYVVVFYRVIYHCIRSFNIDAIMIVCNQIVLDDSEAFCGNALRIATTYCISRNGNIVCRKCQKTDSYSVYTATCNNVI
jgi:hypothetical protein